MSFTRHPRRLSQLACALTLALPGVVLAEGSERDTPIDEQQQQIAEAQLSPAVKAYLDYMLDFDARYPDSGRVDIDRVLSEEGETIASLYCAAIGIDGPCAPEADDRGDFVPLAAQRAGVASPRYWWEWIWFFTSQIGVIPDQNACPAPYQWTQIYMDDENSNNNNGRSGWLGATVSNSNTTWRHCRLTPVESWQFRPLPFAGTSYNYAVLSLGVFCPPGGQRYWRFQDNQGGANGNVSAGPILPNVNVANRNWLTATCHFTGGNWTAGTMTAFPTIGIKYGVYGPQSMPASFALQRGWVYQDDEDFANINYWWPWAPPSAVMNGSNNTWRSLVRVR